MSQMANIGVFDGAATPVSHNLVMEATRVEPNGDHVAVWREQLATVPNEAQVRYTQIKRRLKSGVTICISRVEVPVMESPSGVNSSGYTAPPKIAHMDRADWVSFHDPRSTETTARIASQILLNLMNGVSTSVTPVTAGFPSELHQKQIQVT